MNHFVKRENTKVIESSNLLQSVYLWLQNNQVQMAVIIPVVEDSITDKRICAVGVMPDAIVNSFEWEEDTADNFSAALDTAYSINKSKLQNIVNT